MTIRATCVRNLLNSLRLSSSISLPGCSIAVRRVASLYLAGGLVFSLTDLAPVSLTASPLLIDGSD